MSNKNKIATQTETFYTRASVDPSTIVDTAEEKSFEVVFATENPVFRRGWEENFNEVLSLAPENMRLQRMESGAVPLLNGHGSRHGGVDGQWGRVTAFKIVKGEGRATVRFSTREDLVKYWNDIKAGVVGSISTGYNVYKYLREVVSDNTIPNYRAIDWEPMEISLEPVPADFKSKVRSEEDKHEVIIENFSPVQNTRSNMETNETTVVTPATAPVDTTAVRNEGVQSGIQSERKRVLDIQTAVRNAKLDESFANDLIARAVDINAARAEIINKMAENNSGPDVRTASVTPAAVVADEGDKIREAMSDALLHRSAPGSVKLEDKAHDFKFMSMLDMARHSLELKGEKAGRYSASEVIKRAISTTDYPTLLNSTVERSIRRTYESTPAEWKNIATQTTAKDFRTKTGIAYDGKVTFEEIAEGGEYKGGHIITNDSASIKLKTYGRKISITRQAIVNDDLDVFSKLPKWLAQGASNFQADKVWALITGNAKAPDGKAIFHADHKNLAAAASALSEASLHAARLALYKMQSPAGEMMPVTPKFLLVPIELEQTAEKLMSSVLASAANDVNTVKGKYNIISNPRLTNATAWYLLGDPTQYEGLVYAYLEGEEGLFIEKEVSFNDDSVTTKARLDFDTAVWDYRAWYKNAGV